MKDIVGAGIGGLFGLSVPLMMEVQQIEDNKNSRIEDSQQMEELLPIDPSIGMQYLPDNVCRYLQLEADDPKEQVKECLSVEIFAVPAI